MIITVFQFSGIESPKEEEAVKDSLVFHGVPKDSMEENVGEDPEVMNGILDHTIREFKYE